MKKLIASSLVLFSTVTMASPKVGDTATYNVTLAGASLTQTVTLAAFDPSTKIFTQVTKTSANGQSEEETSYVQESDLLSDATIDSVLTYCESSEINGVIETVTVPAGTFTTCAIGSVQDGSKINIGQAPFGIIKLESATLQGELSSFKRGL